MGGVRLPASTDEDLLDKESWTASFDPPSSQGRHPRKLMDPAPFRDMPDLAHLLTSSHVTSETPPRLLPGAPARAHVSDIGAMNSGGFAPDATDIYSEGFSSPGLSW